jgi:hypothetical protein
VTDFYRRHSWILNMLMGAVGIVLLSMGIVHFMDAGISERHQEFRNYCHAKGGVLFENNNNFDCLINGTRISYYGD